MYILLPREKCFFQGFSKCTSIMAFAFSIFFFIICRIIKNRLRTRRKAFYSFFIFNGLLFFLFVHQDPFEQTLFFIIRSKCSSGDMLCPVGMQIAVPATSVFEFYSIFFLQQCFKLFRGNCL